MSDPQADPSLPEYPGHTGAFGRVVRGVSGLRGSGPLLDPGRVQGTVREYDTIASDLMKVTNSELILLSHLPVRRLRVSIPVEMSRRNIEAIGASTVALGSLQASIVNLNAVTEAAGMRQEAAIGELRSSLDRLRASTDSWSRWLTWLTIGVAVFTAALLFVAIVQVTR